jgi:hypothetical protein
VELVPDVVEALRKEIRGFKVLVSGKGPLREQAERWTIPEVRVLGFLDDKAYTQTIHDADVCLVLQKPDHPFSLGSFPSKVDEYARWKKPIYILRNRDE